MAPERRAGMDHQHYAWSLHRCRCASGSLARRRPDRGRGRSSISSTWSGSRRRSYQSPRISIRIWRAAPAALNCGHCRTGNMAIASAPSACLMRCCGGARLAADGRDGRTDGSALPVPGAVRCRIAWAQKIIAHGISVSRMITSRMGENEERGYIRETLDAIAEATGQRPQGLARAGVRGIHAYTAPAGGRGCAMSATGAMTSSPIR